MNEKEKFIANAMKTLDLTRDEAISLWDDDHAIDRGEKMDFDLTKEQEKAVAEMTKNSGVRKSPAERKASERKRKPNDEKRDIISALYNAMSAFSDVAIDNPERTINFKVGDNEYTIALTCHRKKKGE